MSDELDTVDAVLQHYGVKGMKWGVRRASRNVPQSPTKIVVKKTPGQKVKTSGGKYNRPSADAVKAAKIRQKARKSTTDSLSNQELKALVERMNLEQQYARMAPASGSDKAKKWAAELLLNTGKQQASRVAQDFAAQQVGEMLKKK